MNPTNELVKDRTLGLGGSDAAAILGQTKWSSMLKVYQETIGEAEPTEESEPMFWGNRHEPTIAEVFAERTGKAVHEVHQTLRHDEHPFLCAHIDRQITGENAILEIKTSRYSDGWGEAGTDEIPRNYLCQVLHYLAVTKAERCDVAALIGGNELRIYEVRRDESLISVLVEKEVAFWNNHIVPRIAPDPETTQEAARAWNAVAGKTVEATDETTMDLIHLSAVKEWIKRAKQVEEALKLRSMCALEDAEILVGPGGEPIATWKESKGRETFDKKAFKADHPDLYPQYAKIGKPLRTFLLKKKAVGDLLLPFGAKPPVTMTETEFKVVQTLLAESKEEVA